MKVTQTRFPDVLILEPRVFRDERGFFLESFNQKVFSAATGVDCSFVQDNHSKSYKNVLRGLHYQLPPKDQGKLVRVVQGEVFDVIVDLRKSSPTFGQWDAHTLSAENAKQLWIPPGFAHGFLTLTDTAEFLYKTSNFWSAEHERGLLWNDPAIGIRWPLEGKNPVLTIKDAQAPKLAEADTF
ncbi:dTDP-4-dehydrorhamnose 3,5-epimerase [Orrella sp. NBD-18]|uniref:dTDP-4-dehydrorhamnose 3,5-epimerase n=1 Tax=Sheuella amnicola TaxID=2707330 RepID=A0A6B2QWR4_9BURK|nr:dTDP-4-dehydrorhamnose 3,5-epimerase [Sheuella amnicola]NDY82442.1 dTDP-4-dehydrorhamnose 3,5-epimerase [Sheuella amnicola]